MEIFLALVVVLILIILRIVYQNSKKLDEIKGNMLTKHSFESPVQTYERITGEKVE